MNLFVTISISWRLQYIFYTNIANHVYWRILIESFKLLCQFLTPIHYLNISRSFIPLHLSFFIAPTLPCQFSLFGLIDRWNSVLLTSINRYRRCRGIHIEDRGIHDPQKMRVICTKVKFPWKRDSSIFVAIINYIHAQNKKVQILPNSSIFFLIFICPFCILQNCKPNVFATKSESMLHMAISYSTDVTFKLSSYTAIWYLIHYTCQTSILTYKYGSL